MFFVHLLYVHVCSGEADNGRKKVKPFIGPTDLSSYSTLTSCLMSELARYLAA